MYTHNDAEKMTVVMPVDSPSKDDVAETAEVVSSESVQSPNSSDSRHKANASRLSSPQQFSIGAFSYGRGFDIEQMRANVRRRAEQLELLNSKQIERKKRLEELGVKSQSNNNKK